ncbi:MAG: diguanylate cyclase [Oscillospiraceae bacterium]|nr:diguanylate cyclase [Oscillospiraceae bacterium]
MTAIYYIEINVMCIVILLLLCSQLQQKHGQGSTEVHIFRLLLQTAIVLCAADLLSGVLRGRTFFSARVFTGAGNMLYFLMVTTIGYLWTLYVNVKLHNTSRKASVLYAIPLLFILALAISNPWTEILFSLGKDNLYVRGEGIYLHWVINWLYLLIPTVQIVWAVLHEKNKGRRRDLHILLYFIIAPTAASIIQMLFYGVSCFQVGITISLLIVFLLGQNVQILTDALTGLNNRRAFGGYCDEFIRHHEGEQLFLWMIDINDFKQINDKLGHLVGDRALKNAADALKLVCVDAPNRLFLCRYGGDEFVIAGCGCGAEYEAKLGEQIEREFEKQNDAGRVPYALTASIGTATGECADADDIGRLLRTADKAMYEKKKRAGAR